MQAAPRKRPVIDGPEILYRAINATLALACLGYVLAHHIDGRLLATVQLTMMATWLGYLFSQPVGAAWSTLSTMAAYAYIVFNPHILLTRDFSQHSWVNVIASFVVATLVGRTCGVGTRQAFVFRRAPKPAVAKRPGAGPSPGSGSRR